MSQYFCKALHNFLGPEYLNQTEYAVRKQNLTEKNTHSFKNVNKNGPLPYLKSIQIQINQIIRFINTPIYSLLTVLQGIEACWGSVLRVMCKRILDVFSNT